MGHSCHVFFPLTLQYTLLLMIFATVAQALSASPVMGGCRGWALALPQCAHQCGGQATSTGPLGTGGQATTTSVGAP